MPDDKTMIDYTNKMKSYLRSAEVVEGKNLFSGIIESGGINENGLNAPNTIRVRGKDYYEVDEDTDYIISLTNNVSGKSLKYIVKYYAVADYSTHAIGSSNWITDFTQPISLIQNTKYIRFIFSFTDNSEMTPTNVSDPMLCTQAEWTRSHTYEPYYVPVKDRVDKLEDNPYTILATATGSASTTYADLFSVIKTAYNALSANKKARCEIWQNTNGSSLIFRNFAGIGVFTSMVISSGNALFYIVRFDDNDYRKLTFSTDGTMTNADFSSQLQSQNLYLVMR